MHLITCNTVSFSDIFVDKHVVILLSDYFRGTIETANYCCSVKDDIVCHVCLLNHPIGRWLLNSGSHAESAGLGLA